MCMNRQGGPKKSSKGLSHPSLPVIATFARKLKLLNGGRGRGKGKGNFMSCSCCHQPKVGGIAEEEIYDIGSEEVLTTMVLAVLFS